MGDINNNVRYFLCSCYILICSLFLLFCYCNISSILFLKLLIGSFDNYYIKIDLYGELDSNIIELI